MPDPRQAVLFRTLRRMVFLGLAGTVALAVAVLLLWEVVFHALGVASGNEFQWPYLIRGFTTSMLIAGFAAVFFWRARRRLGSEWEEIRRRREELEKMVLCEDDSLGLAALSRALAHELRGPLHAIALRAAMVRKAARGMAGGALLIDLARTIEEEAARADHQLRSYMGRAGDATQSLQRERVDLAALLRLASHELAPLAAERRVHLEPLPEGSQGPEVEGDPLLLHRALRVLVRGAVEAAPPGTSVGFHAGVSGGAAVLTLLQERRPVDAGALFGIAGEPAAARAALGLALVKDVARAHGGELVVAGAEAGAAIALRLPVGS